jgi:hypothetical protein
MDKFWSICTMPIGVLICFVPAMLVWALTRSNDASDEPPDRH